MRSIQVLDEYHEPMRQLLLVSPNTLQDIWGAVLPLFEEGKEYWGKWTTLEGIYRGISSSRLQLWLMNDEDEFLLAMLTQIVKAPKGDILKITWIEGSDVDSAMRLFFDYMELWAHRQGISRVKLEGRRGWIRKLSSSGYELTGYVLEKDISGIKEH